MPSRNDTAALSVQPLFAPAPTNFRAAVDGSTVQLMWDQPSSAAAWQLEAGSAPGLSDLAVYRTTAGTSVTVTGVPTGVYYARVRSAAVGFGDLSVPSNEITVAVGGACIGPPAAPANFRTFSFLNAPGRMAVFWDPPAGPPPASYVLEVGSGPGLSDLVVFDTGSPVTSVQGTPPFGRAIYLRVRAQNGCGLGPASNEITEPPLRDLIIGLNGPTLPGSSPPLCVNPVNHCRFTALTTNGDTYPYRLFTWDFGDGTTMTTLAGMDVQHAYARPSSATQVTVTLTATDDYNRTKVTSKAIALAADDPAPIASLHATGQGTRPNACLDRRCGLTASNSIGTGLTYSWDFGDGTTGTGISVLHTFPGNGSYNVRLTVTDYQGRTDSVTRVIKIGSY